MILSVVTVSLILLPTSSTIQDVTKSKYDRYEYFKRLAEEKYKMSVRQRLRHPLGEGDVSREKPGSMIKITPRIQDYDEGIIRLGIITTPVRTKRTTSTPKAMKTTTEQVFKPGVNVFIENENQTPLPFPPNPLSDEVMLESLMDEEEVVKKHKKHHGHRKGKKTHVSSSTIESGTTAKVMDIFYRRLTDDRTRNLPLRWVHCNDMITPYLTGPYEDQRDPQKVGPKDKMVVRLVHLVNLNTTTLTNEELTGVLHQINQISIKLFHWDTKAIRMLFGAICKGRKHSFNSLKRGILKLFKKWKLNIKDVNGLLTKPRIFHPPCVNSIAFDGSTKTSKWTTYTTLDQETTTSSKCADDDDDEDEERR